MAADTLRFRDYKGLCPSSWPGLTRPSTPSSAPAKAWMRGSSPRKTDIQGIRRYTPVVAGGS
jgi:hypothetical protein